MVDEYGTVQLCDFGLSRIRYEITRTHTNIQGGGRYRFLAPELTLGLENSRTNEASDVYSLAMTMYALGTRGSPFKEVNELAAAQAVQRGERPAIPTSLGGLDMSMTQMLSEIMVKMWIHKPVLRPSVATVQFGIYSMIVRAPYAP